MGVILAMKFTLLHGISGMLLLHVNSQRLSRLSLISRSAVSSNLVPQRRYGAAAGQATDHAMDSAINVGVTAFNIDNLGIKAIVKKTGKQTAKAILDDYKLKEKPESGKQVEKSD